MVVALPLLPLPHFHFHCICICVHNIICMLYIYIPTRAHISLADIPTCMHTSWVEYGGCQMPSRPVPARVELGLSFSAHTLFIQYYYYTFIIASVPGLPRSVLVLIMRMRKRQTFFGSRSSLLSSHIGSFNSSIMSSTSVAL